MRTTLKIEMSPSFNKNGFFYGVTSELGNIYEVQFDQEQKLWIVIDSTGEEVAQRDSLQDCFESINEVETELEFE